ncbi:MAG: hypothetical protein A2Y80_10925 [Deltaproteobacteria bacterium RBG_13_58_19]|nr:MAG: hypothetical protein A2Y80_10925 [Deltaproteobacteria bacterium RBG_13_58_19]
MVSILDQHLSASDFLDPVSEEWGGYVPVPLRYLSLGKEIPFDVFLRVRSRKKSQVRFILACAQGYAFKKKWYAKLHDLGLPCLYFSQDDGENVLGYLDRNLGNFLSEEKLSQEGKASLLCDVTLLWLRTFFTQEEERTGARWELALRYIDEFFEIVKRNEAICNLVIHIWRYDHRLFTHCLNTCLFGLAFTTYLDWLGPQVRDFALGALLHDAGMTQLPRSIYNKTEKLNLDEWFLVVEHPVLSSELMKKLPRLRPEVLAMVRQHHENSDGSGYPYGLEKEEINPWARILRIIDSYEALSAARSWRPAKTPLEALWVIRDSWQKSNIYDPDYLTAFIKFLGGLKH